MVFVSGEVGKVGGVELEEREFISVTQALSISGGLTRDADVEKARVLRPILNTSKRAEIPVNLKLVLAGRADDYPLMPNDVLFVPRKRSHTDTLAKISVVVVPVVLSTVLYAVLR
jgi:protein involved in polysaccharide export with SLBB domain